MKLCNDTVTLFSGRVDPQTGGDVWTPTVIAGCSWYATDASAVDAGRGGLVAAGRVTVRIPGEAAPAGLAIRNGDIVVRGDASGMGDPAPAKLKKAWGADCATVLAVTDNRRAPRAPHWRITGT